MTTDHADYDWQKDAADCYTLTIAKKHLHRYAAEFEFRYNNRTASGVDDVARSEVALRAAVGKRLTYAV